MCKINKYDKLNALLFPRVTCSILLLGAISTITNQMAG